MAKAAAAELQRRAEKLCITSQSLVEFRNFATRQMPSMVSDCRRLI
jgi:hypothetical protein